MVIYALSKNIKKIHRAENNMLKRHNIMGVGEGDEAPLTTKTKNEHE